jgi:hypothetical protein
LLCSSQRATPGTRDEFTVAAEPKLMPSVRDTTGADSLTTEEKTKSGIVGASRGKPAIDDSR